MATEPPRLISKAWYVLVYAASDLLPLRLAAEEGGGRFAGLWATSKRWLTTLLNLLSLGTLIVAALVIGGLVIGTTTLIRETIEKNPLALVVEVHGGIGSAVKTISDADEAEIRSFGLQAGAVAPLPANDASGRVVYRVSGWNDYALWFYRKDGSRDTDFTPGRTVQTGDPLLEKVHLTRRAGQSGVFSRENAPEIVVTASLLKQLGYEAPPDVLMVEYQQRAAPLKVIAIAEWLPAGDFLMGERFYRVLRDKRWTWPPMHRHACFGPVTAQQAQEILDKAKSYLRDQNVDATVAERAGSAKWLVVKLRGDRKWDQGYWEKTFFPTIAVYLASAPWLRNLTVDFDDPLPRSDEGWSAIDIGYTRASVYVKELSLIPAVVAALKARGLGVDDRIAQEVVFLQQVSAFGRRLFGWVIGAVALMAAVNIGLSFAQTIRRKQAQIGILRAYGASRRFIFSIYLCEATIIWILAAVLGCAIACPAGETIGRNVMEAWQTRSGAVKTVSKEDAPKFFRSPPSLFALTLGGSLLVCWTATAWAALAAARVNPATAVRSRE
jgi:hypothetical protein